MRITSLFVLLVFSLSIHGQVVIDNHNGFPDSGAVPVIESYTSNYSSTTTKTLALTKPNGVVSGDLLLILVGNDFNNDTPVQFDDASNKPTGFTLIKADQGTVSDAATAAYYRISDGTEGATATANGNTLMQMWGSYIRISGATAIGTIGSSLKVVGSSHAIPSITTANANALVISVYSSDGSDTNPFTITGTDWVEQDEVDGGTNDAASVAGGWASKVMATIGASGICTVGFVSSDGITAFQFEVY